MPDRIIKFRVTWTDSQGKLRLNNGWRVQHNNAAGPYKGGLRFHPEVSLDSFKFLAFEQTFKNALTGLPLGGAKGGADFSPKEETDTDVMRFCKAFMRELHKYIGPDRDVPAGDIGVGRGEIGYLFGAYKALTGRFHGALTGKSLSIGGSRMREASTGYGCVYFIEKALSRKDIPLSGQRCALSGAGNVALHAAEKLAEKQAKVITLSDSRGMIHAEDGLTPGQVNEIKQHKLDDKGTLSEVAGHLDNVIYSEEDVPWTIAADIAMPAAIQNEISDDLADEISKNGTHMVCEAANMPLTQGARDKLRDSDVIVLPAKAVNAGGVIVSNFERSQNSQKLSWTKDKVDDRLRERMSYIHDLCVSHAADESSVAYHYISGANRAAFRKLAEAICSQGHV